MLLPRRPLHLRSSGPGSTHHVTQFTVDTALNSTVTVAHTTGIAHSRSLLSAAPVP